MADFDRALRRVLRHEGGYVDNPDDPGGATNMGITHITLADYRQVPSITPDQVRDITQEEVASIYREKYWESLSLDSIPSQGIAEAIFDHGVNAGIGRGAKLAQETINTLTGSKLLTVDGQMGPLTLQQVNRVPPPTFLIQFFTLRMTYYKEICRKNKKLRQFLYSWLTRALEHSEMER